MGHDPVTSAPDTAESLNEMPVAVTHEDGTREWVMAGRTHRLDGPAIIHEDGSVEWWRNGVRATATQERCLSLAADATCMDDLKDLMLSDVDGWVAAVLLWNDYLRNPVQLTPPARAFLAEMAIY